MIVSQKTNDLVLWVFFANILPFLEICQAVQPPHTAHHYEVDVSPGAEDASLSHGGVRPLSHKEEASGTQRLF